MTWDELYANHDRWQLESELESLHSYFDSCREIGQGINSKEVIQERVLIKALATRFGVVRSEWF